MNVRTFSTSTVADAPLVTTAETVIATLTGVSTSSRGQVIDFTGYVTLTTGTGTTSVTLRVREDSLTGTIVGEANADSAFAAAGGTETHAIATTAQTPGEFSGKTYVLTAQQGGATGNGSALNASLRASVR